MVNEWTRKILMSLMLVLIMSLFAGCSGTSSIIGKWEYEGSVDGGYHSEDDFPFKMELFDDGAGIVDQHYSDMGISWKIENGRLRLTLPYQTVFVYDYEISGESLTLTNDEGEGVIYKKGE